MRKQIHPRLVLQMEKTKKVFKNLSGEPLFANGFNREEAFKKREFCGRVATNQTTFSSLVGACFIKYGGNGDPKTFYKLTLEGVNYYADREMRKQAEPETDPLIMKQLDYLATKGRCAVELVMKTGKIKRGILGKNWQGKITILHPVSPSATLLDMSTINEARILDENWSNDNFGADWIWKMDAQKDGENAPTQKLIGNIDREKLEFFLPGMKDSILKLVPVLENIENLLHAGADEQDSNDTIQNQLEEMKRTLRLLNKMADRSLNR